MNKLFVAFSLLLIVVIIKPVEGCVVSAELSAFEKLGLDGTEYRSHVDEDCPENADYLSCAKRYYEDANFAMPGLIELYEKAKEIIQGCPRGDSGRDCIKKEFDILRASAAGNRVPEYEVEALLDYHINYNCRKEIDFTVEYDECVLFEIAESNERARNIVKFSEMVWATLKDCNE